MENSQHVKTFSNDPRSKNRLRYIPARTRAKKASADVYRSYKGRSGVVTTSASSREERVHHLSDNAANTGKHKRIKRETNSNLIKIIQPRTEGNGQVDLPLETEDTNEILSENTTFAEELDFARDRNSSQLFSKLYYQLLPYVGSLPEILHHSKKILLILLFHLLTDQDLPIEGVTMPEYIFNETAMWLGLSSMSDGTPKKRFFINIVTTDVLHLIAVLARDLRHEIHPFVHSFIMPRIVNHLITSSYQTNPDVAIMESAFRTLSYVFRYDSFILLNNDSLPPTGGAVDITHAKKNNSECLDTMRKYYGLTLAHRQEFVRRLAAETFAPLIRKLNNNSARKKHIRRVLKSLAASIVLALQTTTTAEESSNAIELNNIHAKLDKNQIDAMDGISQLLFYASRGVSGHLHSKGREIIRILLDYIMPNDVNNDRADEYSNSKLSSETLIDEADRQKKNVLHIVATMYFSKIRIHINNSSSFSPVWEVLYNSINKCLTMISSNLDPQRSCHIEDAMRFLIVLVNDCMSYKNGQLLNHPDQEYSDGDKESKLVNHVKIIPKLLHNIFDESVYNRFTSSQTQNASLHLLCNSWKFLSDNHASFSNESSSTVFTTIINKCMHQSDESDCDIENRFMPAIVLASDLLPQINDDKILQPLVSELLLAAVRSSQKETTDSKNDNCMALNILYLVSTSIRKVIDKDKEAKLDTTDDYDNLFLSEQLSQPFILHKSDIKVLLELCHSEIINFDHDECKTDLSYARLACVAQCLPFIALVRCSDETNIEIPFGKHISDMIIQSLTTLSSKCKVVEKNSTPVVVCKALLLEALSHILRNMIESTDENAKFSSRILQRARDFSNELLFEYPSSIFVIKATSELVNILARRGIQLNDEWNKTFDLLSPNLRSKSHFLRLHTLEILSSFPNRPFVTNHDDVHCSEDLDEEPTYKFSNSHDGVVNQIHSGPSGICDIIQTLLQIEATPVSLLNERKLIAAINRVEVIGRTGKLPVAYAEATTNHMFGFMYTKFQPLWKPLTKALVALVATSQQNDVWPIVETQLKQLMVVNVDSNKNDSDEIFEKVLYGRKHIIDTYNHLIAWESSIGLNPILFSSQVLQAQEKGRVSRHQSTDADTIFEIVWSVLEDVPQVVANRSRVFVPIFLRFLHEQYYVLHDDDPDSRELRLQQYLSEEDTEIKCWSRDELNRKMLQRKLTMFLKVFSQINGMQQLFKHPLLLAIFVAFLSNPDASVANLSLSCILKYKLPYVNPYVEFLRNMLAKGKLRETLTKFNLSVDVDIHDRKKLLPIITRILFGRLLARSGGTKSSKDSPAVRRTAILSFLSSLNANEQEYDYMMYMMVRAYIPKEVNMMLGETGHENAIHIRNMIHLTENISEHEFYFHTQIQRHEGFLNLIGDVIKQVGYGIEDFISVFMNLIICLIEATEKYRGNENEEDSDTSSENDDFKPNNRIGKIRNLCFKRISELLKKFSQTFDFKYFSERLWMALSPAVSHLPNTVINAERAPSILLLLESLSSNINLIQLLYDHPGSVKSVFECVASTSRYNVMDSVLTFTHNLLTDGGILDGLGDVEERLTNPQSGLKLVLLNMNLLIQQFTLRLKSGGNTSQYNDPREKNMIWREFYILCRVSELLVFEDYGPSILDCSTIDMMEKLCELIMPYLRLEHLLHEKNRNDVLGILESILPRIRSNTAILHLQSLSKLLGPNKGNSGITSLETRQKIVSCIKSISSHQCYVSTLGPVVKALQSLCSTDPKHVDEINFDEVLPILNGLGNNESSLSWRHYTRNVAMSHSNEILHLEVKVLSPLMYWCLNMLYDQDGVLSRGAYKALQNLIVHAYEAAMDSQYSRDGWGLKIIETSLIPNIIIGLKSGLVNVRRSFILLLREISKRFTNNDSPHLYSDLQILIKDEDPDIDFFLNITHVQIHRRARALTRLRKLMNGDNGDRENISSSCPFTPQSLSNILLPLATHPIYECKLKTEEPYALEAIATVGSIARYLNWGKYQSTLWSALIQLSRNSEQEKYLVSLICALLESFHFDMSSISNPESDLADIDVNVDETCNDVEDIADNTHQSSSKTSAIWRQLTKRFIPKLESCITKENTENKDESTKRLRPPIVLALVNLFLKFPTDIFKAKLPQFLIIICNSLKNKDSDEREVGRATLSKVAVTIGVEYLSDIIRELVITLNDGYQLHVRSASLHSILLALAKEYKRPEDYSIDDASSLPFDKSVPGMMDIILQDIFGKASEMKEAEGVKRRVIKEAIGVKSYSSLELISELILFKPSSVISSQVNSVNKKQLTNSAVHNLITPFMEKLRDPEIDNATIGKIKESLNRIVLGLSRNTSTTAEELMPFVYAILSPLLKSIHSSTTESDDEVYSEEEDGVEISKVTSTTKKATSVFVWTPSKLKGANDGKAAHEQKLKDKVELRKVKDGVNAPKLTGKARVRVLKSSTNGLTDPVMSSAIIFGLSLLHSCSKKSKLDGKEGMADPFVRILTHCVRYSTDTDIILLSLKNLQSFLRLNLPSLSKYKKALASNTLRLLSVSGSSYQNEVSQVCFKTLGLLITHEHKWQVQYSDKAVDRLSEHLLDDSQMKVLISFLQASVADYDQSNSTFSVIKSITSSKYVSSEYYDLMETILKLTVQSRKDSVRQQASQIFLQYLIEYPMGNQRIEQHLKQIVLNIKYEYEEGRLSALELVRATLVKLPTPILEEHVQIFFLPLVLQLVNDNGKACREKTSECLSILLQRISVKILQSLYEYTTRWAKKEGVEGLQLRRTSVQLFGMIVSTRLDFVKRGDKVNEIIHHLHECLIREMKYPSEHDGSDTKKVFTDILMSKDWELCYFCLHSLELLNNSLPSALKYQIDVWDCVIKCLMHPHPWVQQISSRLIESSLSKLNPQKINEETECFLLSLPGSLFDIARNLCYQLNADEKKQMESLSTLAIKNLTWVIQAMHTNPGLCWKDESEGKLDHDDILDDDSEKEEDTDNVNIESCRDKSISKKHPVNWLITRLSNIAKLKSNVKRSAVFKCFAAFATFCSEDIIIPFLPSILEPLNRALSEEESRIDSKKQILLNSNRSNGSMEVADSEMKILVEEVMQLLEEKCGSELFVNALASVKRIARDKREKRKHVAAAEMVYDPATAAKRKIVKQERERERRKRRVEERKQSRGVFTKKPRHVV